MFKLLFFKFIILRTNISRKYIHSNNHGLNLGYAAIYMSVKIIKIIDTAFIVFAFRFTKFLRVTQAYTISWKPSTTKTYSQHFFFLGLTSFIKHCLTLSRR